MIRVRRPSDQTTAVLLALGATPSEWRYGYDLCQETELKAGTMYPILMRLADRGLLETAWEQNPPPGRPPRHMYRLSGEGRKLVTELEQESRHRSKQARLRPQAGGAA